MSYKDVVTKIISERSFFMGVAILMIVLYHTPSGCFPPVIKKLLYPGFIGVDFFLFYSAYGLSHSIGKRSVKDFYLRRLSRIIPLFLILAICKSLLYIGEGNSMTTFDWFCNLTTLSYYGFGGFIFDWYLCILLLLYFLFPLFVKGVDAFYKQTNGGGINVQWTIILVLFSLIGFDWQFETAIARIPVFTLGILCARHGQEENYRHALISFSSFFVISVILLFNGFIHTYVLIYLLAPVVLSILAFLFFLVIRIDRFLIYKYICYVGNITLEMYVANNIALSMMNFAPSFIPRLLAYIFLNVFLAIILIYVNKLITNKINIWRKNV